MLEPLSQAQLIVLAVLWEDKRKAFPQLLDLCRNMSAGGEPIPSELLTAPDLERVLTDLVHRWLVTVSARERYELHPTVRALLELGGTLKSNGLYEVLHG